MSRGWLFLVIVLIVLLAGFIFSSIRSRVKGWMCQSSMRKDADQRRYGRYAKRLPMTDDFPPAPDEENK